MPWLGIDFSGDHVRWQPHHPNSNVWVATVEDNHGLCLVDVCRVQELEGDGHPFDRLVSLLADGEYQASAIDAPFSVPARYVPAAGHAELLASVVGLPHPGRPFPDGASFVHGVTGQLPPLDPCKPLRSTEQFWRNMHVNVRSTLWNGARPGAPMTAACLKLLAYAERSIWPWVDDEPGVLVEAFPSAQLRHWGWPCTGYNGPEGRAKRMEIVRRLEDERGLLIPQNLRGSLLDSADALDAVLCAFAAIAVTEGDVAFEPDPAVYPIEGWIAVSARNVTETRR